MHKYMYTQRKQEQMEWDFVKGNERIKYRIGKI